MQILVFFGIKATNCIYIIDTILFKNKTLNLTSNANIESKMLFSVFLSIIITINKSTYDKHNCC